MKRPLLQEVPAFDWTSLWVKINSSYLVNELLFYNIMAAQPKLTPPQTHTHTSTHTELCSPTFKAAGVFDLNQT